MFLEHIKILQSKSPFKFTKFGFEISKAKKFLNFSFWLFIMKFSSLTVNQFDKVIVSSFLGTAYIPLYYGLVRVIQIPGEIIEVMKSAVIPISSEIKTSNSQAEFTSFIIAGVTQLNVIFALSIFIIVIFTQEILFLLGGKEFLQYISLVQYSLILLMPLAGRAFFSSALIGSGEVVKRQALWSIISSTSFIILLWYLLFNYNLQGGIISKSINQFFMYFLWVFLIAKFTSIGIKNFLLLTLKGQFPYLLLCAIFLLSIKYFTFEYKYMLPLKFLILIATTTFTWKYVIDKRIKHYLSERIGIN
jgi:O-antigen/teichoic acid export membrane protein